MRTATAEAHARVDTIFSRFPLGQACGYRAFLRAIAAAHVHVEAAIERSGAAARLVGDWPERRRAALLCADLEELGEACPVADGRWAFDDEAALLGAIYVLEGSRLGGALLRKQVPAQLPRRFLSASAPAGAWRALSALLDRELSDGQKLDRAISAARQVFTSFEAAGLEQLEPVA
jgi:heme oxygenase